MQSPTGSRIVVVMTLVFAVAAPFAASAAPQAELWPRWEAHDPGGTQPIDHGDWQEFLDEYLITDHPSGVNRVDYAGVTAADRAMLRGYISAMEAVEIGSRSRDVQLPYWINLYNALTVELILEHYPLDSIRDIRNPWDTPVAEVEGVALTLNDIEHRIIRPIWMDERIHYVVNCASYGCPNLQPVALTADNYDRMFDAAAREYINHPRGADFSGPRPTLSSIYDWYQADFGDGEEDVLAHLAEYADEDLGRALERYAGGRIRYEYSWELNAP